MVDLEQTLFDTAVCNDTALYCGGDTCPGSNNVYGHGRIDVFEAVSATIGMPYDIPWLSEAPLSGTLAPDNSMNITITFDASGMQAGTFFGGISIRSNDPLVPFTGVPVTMTVTPRPVPPSSVTIIGDESGWLGSPFTFKATTEPISTSLPLNYLWEASGQDAITHTTGVTDMVSFTWSSLGTQVVTATASNNFGWVTGMHVIEINDAPISGLSAANDSPTLLGSATTLTATVNGGTNVSFTWDFGDGSGGVGASLTHTYPVPGIFTATVTATNSTNSLTKTTLVSITPFYRNYLPLVFKPDRIPLAPAIFLPGGGLVFILVYRWAIRWRKW